MAKPLWVAGDIGAWVSSCSSFLRHLLSPTTVLEDEDQMHPMLFATRLFLTTLDADVTDLPDADDLALCQPCRVCTQCCLGGLHPCRLTTLLGKTWRYPGHLFPRLGGLGKRSMPPGYVQSDALIRAGEDMASYSIDLFIYLNAWSALCRCTTISLRSGKGGVLWTHSLPL